MNMDINLTQIQKEARMKKYDVIVIIDYYLPGRLSGGPVTTIEGLTTMLGEGIKFLILTHNYDIGHIKYDNIVEKEYYTIGDADVIYVNDIDFNPKMVEFLIKKHSIAYLYFNSFFSKVTIFSLMRNKYIKFKAKVIVAPRGEFSEGALNIRKWKKYVYIKLFLALKLYQNVTFQASNEIEKNAVVRIIPLAEVKIASDIPVMRRNIKRTSSFESTRIVFISRIVPMKNLDYAVKILNSITQNVTFHVYGPIEDKKYWEKCQNIIKSIPKNIQVEYCGTLDHSKVGDTFKEYDAFLIPSLGENFGHVIFESLSAGCPVIVSDRTPWQDLEIANVGWVLPLERPEKFTNAIRSIINSTTEQKIDRSHRCIAYAYKVSHDKEVISDNYRLFDQNYDDLFHNKKGETV
jgi:glycosyltransferase involved in cell wall biosynthesis